MYCGGSVAVSYTHLDVYKRQVSARKITADASAMGCLQLYRFFGVQYYILRRVYILHSDYI